MEVKQIEAKDTHDIRHKILRPHGEVEDCLYPGDNDDLTFHLGAYVNDKLVSVASFYMDNHPEIEDEYQFRLRGMATLDEFRGQGMSSALLRTAFPLIKKNHVNMLWCNARTSALGFYKKVGFEEHGNIFEIESIGPHKLMLKKLN
jgi:predicted GNAT family N-acyltransferase